MPSVIPGPKTQPFYFFGTLFLIVAMLSLAKTVLIPIALAVLLTFLLTPVVRLLQRRGVKRVLAVVIVIIGALLVIGILAWAMSMQVVRFVQELPKFEETILQKIKSFQQPGTNGIQKMAQNIGKAVSGAPIDPHRIRAMRAAAVTIGSPAVSTGAAPLSLVSALQSMHDRFEKKDDPEPATTDSRPIGSIELGNVLQFFIDMGQEAVRLIASVGIVLVLVIVMLICREEMRDRFIRLTGNARLTVTTRALDEASRRISDYMFRKLIVNAIFGAIIAFALLLIGVRFSLMWGFLLVVLRFIPGLGIWLAAIPPLVLSLITTPAWQPVILVVILFGVGELVLINVVEPRYVGAQIGLFPVAAMVSLTFWTWLWGPVGLFLAIPLTMCLSVLGKYVPHLSVLGVLLSEQPAMDVTLRYYQRLLANDQDEAIEIVDGYLREHNASQVFDMLMMPALATARRDVYRGELAESDLTFFFRATREMLDDVPIADALDRPDNDGLPASRDDYAIAGIPIGDEADELVLRMTAKHLAKHGWPLDLCPPNKLSSEIVEWVDHRKPNILCLASIAPGRLAQTRIACKRLHKQFPDRKIVIARLGEPDNFEKDREILMACGADIVCDSIEETRKALMNAVRQLGYAKAKEASDGVQS